MIGFLTILGYSLYDTVVVFDKVRENTQNLTATAKSTFSEAANLAVNQTLVRSINTSVVALLPIASILVIGTILVGAGTLEDLALALFVGIATGTYSSIFIATPLLADLRERQPEMKALRGPGAQAPRRPGGRGVRPGRHGRRGRDGRRRRHRGRGRRGPRSRPRRPPAPRRRAPAARATSPSGPRRSPAASAADRRPTERCRPGRCADLAGRVRSLVRDVPDFPAAGHPVQGHHPAAGRRAGVRGARRGLGRPPTPAIDVVAGIEARGFILAAPLAVRLGVGFVPVRKAGKLPGRTEQASYALEYGEATLEITADAVRPGQRILLVDDVLATGGTAAAAVDLLERAGRPRWSRPDADRAGRPGGRDRLPGREVATVSTSDATVRASSRA